MFSDFGSHTAYHSIRKCSPLVRHSNSFCEYLTKFKGRCFLCVLFFLVLCILCVSVSISVCICVHVCVNKFVYEPLCVCVSLCVSMSV